MSTRTTRGRGTAARRALLLVTVLTLAAPACGTGSAGNAGAATDGAPGGTDRASTALVPVTTVVAPSAPELPVTVTSADGRKVTVSDVSRLVVLRGNIAEVVFGLGLGANVVGRDISATFPEVAAVPLVTQAHDVSAESVLSLRPTLVLADAETGPPEAIEQIRNIGVPLITFAVPTSVADVGPRIEAIAAALGLADAGRALAERTTGAIGALTAGIGASPRPRVAFLYLRGHAGVYLIGGKGSGADSMIDAAGGVDAGTALGLDTAFTPITSEALVAAAPDVILMTTTGLESVGGIDGLVRIPGVGQTPAGKDRRVVTLEDGTLYSFGVRTPDAIAQLAGQLHPPR